ncbi:ribonuclease, partial [Streptomyces anulatus]
MSRRHSFYARPLLAAVAAVTVLAGTAAAAPSDASPGRYTATSAALDDTYYQDALGKTGAELKSALNTIISDQTKLSYSQVWDALKATDEDPANSSNVILLYTGR